MGLMDKVTQVISKDKHDNTATSSTHGTDSSIRHPVSSEHNQYATPGAFPGDNTTGQGSHFAGASASRNTYDPSRQDGSSGFGPNSGTSGLGSHSNTTGLGSNTGSSGVNTHSNIPGLSSNTGNSGIGSHSNTTGLGSNTTGSGLGSHSNTTGLGSNTNTGYGSSHGVAGQDHVNRDGYGSSNTTGPQTTAGPHNSDMLNKLDPRVDSDQSKSQRGQSGLTGTGHGSNQHSSNSGVQNLIPGSHAENPSAIPTAGGERVGATDNYGSNTGYPSSQQQNTTAGPHNSNLLNKADPTVDSDRSRQYDNQHHGRDAGIAGAGVGAGAYGAEHSRHNHDSSLGHTEPHSSSHRDHGLGSHSTSTTHSSQPHTSQYDHSNTSSSPEHKSSLLNKLDPRVKDESKLQKEREQEQHHYGRDAAIGGAGVGAGAYGAERHHDKHSATHGTDSNFSRNEPYGSSTSTTAPYNTSGPHNTYAANQLDPHVNSSDRSHHNTTGTTGLGSSTSHHDSRSTTADNTTAGPHKSDMLNKLDPRVDSDASRLRDQQQYGTSGHNTAGHNTSDRSGIDDVTRGTSGLGLGSGSSHKKHDYGYSAAHQSAYDQGYKDALAHLESQRRN